MKILKTTTNGKIFTCGKCNAIHIEYKNINFNLSKDQFLEYAKYLNKLNGSEWEEANQSSPLTRKIIIPTQDTHISLLLNNQELNELKKLFECHITSKSSKSSLLYKYHLN